MSAEVISLSLNEVGWKGLQPSEEGREGEGSWVVMGDVWGSVEGKERVRRKVW